MKQQTKYTN